LINFILKVRNDSSIFAGNNRKFVNKSKNSSLLGVASSIAADGVAALRSGNKIRNGKNHFMPDRADYWNLRIEYRTGNNFFVERPQIFQRSAARPTIITSISFCRFKSLIFLTISSAAPSPWTLLDAITIQPADSGVEAILFISWKVAPFFCSNNPNFWGNLGIGFFVLFTTILQPKVSALVFQMLLGVHRLRQASLNVHLFDNSRARIYSNFPVMITFIPSCGVKKTLII